eukprot:TRINITY_DN7663_c0_g1_i1.p1 TRINITY_DN7663_c0_g1~~TRINITY_DN7663_c0_g1_i1.p1  ORF type:complete len:535 (-),score=175.42 TRINITY_DN7663_c0_g1_i1:94-1698(-)
MQGAPDKLALEWASKIEIGGKIEKVISSGPFINFYVEKKSFIKSVLGRVFEEKEKYGFSEIGKGKKVIVEYSSPNIAKPFHAGHLRSTIIGNFLKHLHRALGYEVIGINYLGDWGKQFGLLAIGFEKHGSEELLKTDPIKHLYDVYVAINLDADEDPTIHDKAREYFNQMEQGDKKSLELWQKFRDMSIEEYKRIYGRLNIEFDVYSGESQFSEGMKEELKNLDKLNLMKKTDNGANVIDLQKFKLGITVVQKKDGSTLYITRDIAAAVDRQKKYNFDEMFYVVAAPQDLHFKQLFKTLDLMGYEWSKKCNHINFGMVKDGTIEGTEGESVVKNMSTRKGQVIFLKDILDKAKQNVLEVMKKNEKKFSEIENPEEIADIVGISAVVIQDLSARRIKDYAFNWKRIGNFEGHTGAYLQYAHARLCSMERKVESQGTVLNKDANLDLLVEPEAFLLVKAISLFNYTLINLKKSYEPQTLVSYLFELSHAISRCHNTLYVFNEKKDIADARFFLFWAAKNVLCNGLKILGLVPIYRM